MKPSHEMRQGAEDAIQYYERLVSNQVPGQNWALGLFMAKQWYRMLQEEKPNLEEVRLFLVALNNDVGTGSCGGSGWHSMAIDVRNWLKSPENLADHAAS